MLYGMARLDQLLRNDLWGGNGFTLLGAPSAQDGNGVMSLRAHQGIKYPKKEDRIQPSTWDVPPLY